MFETDLERLSRTLSNEAWSPREPPVLAKADKNGFKTRRIVFDTVSRTHGHQPLQSLGFPLEKPKRNAELHKSYR
jgi:hypothetical protein